MAATASHTPPEPDDDSASPLTPAQHRLVETVYRTSHATLCTYAIHMGAVSREDAEDTVHHAFLQLVRGHRCLSDPAGEEAVRKYLYVTITGRLKNAWRDTTLHDEYTEQDPEAIQAAVGPIPPPAPEELVLTAELSALLARGIRRLPPRPRQVWLLKRQGHTYTQIAAMLHISVSTVNGHMVFALNRLREIVQEWRDSQPPEEPPADTPPTDAPLAESEESVDTPDAEDLR